LRTVVKYLDEFVKNRTVKVLVLLQQYQKSIGIGIAILFWNLYWYWYWQYILLGVLALVLPILFKSIVNNPAGLLILFLF